AGDVVAGAHDLLDRFGIFLGAARVDAERAGNAESIQKPDDAPDAHPAAISGPGFAGMIDRAGFEMRGLHRVGRGLVIRPGLEHHGHRDGDLLAVRPRQSACHHILLQCAISGDYSTIGMPIAGMSFSHFLASSRMKMPNSVGSIHAASQPMRNNFSRKAGWFTTASLSRTKRATIGSGIWAGASKPNQVSMRTSGIPSSAVVGTSANIGCRRGPVWARTRSAPPSATRALASPSDTISICPATASLAACPPPR